MWSDPYEEETAGSGSGEARACVYLSLSLCLSASVFRVLLSFTAFVCRATQQPTSWFVYNATRQCSYVYGAEAVANFLKANKLTSLIRAHEVQQEGYASVSLRCVRQICFHSIAM